MSFDPSRYIHIDWKVSGADWLVMLRDLFPEVVMLQGSAFDALFDELAHEEVEVCLQTLANTLHGHGYEVWNVDVGGADDFRVALVPVAERAAFEHYWRTIRPLEFEGDENAEVQLQRTLPEIARRQTDTHRARYAKGASDAARSKPDWLAEKKRFSSFEADRTGVRDGRVLARRAGESGEWGQVREWWFWLMDLRQWPPALEPVHEVGPHDVPAFPRMAAADGEATVWQWQVDETAREQLRVRRDRHWAAFGPQDASFPRAAGADESDLWHDGWLWSVRCIGQERRWQISRTGAAATEVVYDDLEYPGRLHAFGVGRVLLVLEGFCRVWEAGRMGETRHLPVTTGGPQAVAWLGGNEILFFDHFVRDVAAPWWRDQVLRAWRFDVVTGESRCAEMDGFGVQYNAPPLEIDGTVQKRKCMAVHEHGVHIERGHADWWVVNYQDNVLGVRTIAWIWNAATNEVVTITSKDIPRWQPTIVYVADQGRYFGLDTGGVIRLPEFDTIRAANGGTSMVWVDQPRV